MRPWTKMKGDTAPMMEYPFSVIIDSDENCFSKNNPKFESFDRYGEEEGLNCETVPSGVDLNAADFFDELIYGYEGILAMFGHSYDYISRRWEGVFPSPI
eukprot:gene34596-44727_t